MSSQHGNVNKKGPQKYRNKTAFRNDLHDNSKKLKQINSTEFNGLCERCIDVLKWKVKYRKYKPLTIPKKCVKCLEKKVKIAYYIICQDCCLKHKICSKCAKDCENVDFGETEVERMQKEQEFQFELKQLTERKRRKFLRLLEKGLLQRENLTEEGKKANLDEYDDDSKDGESNDEDEFDDLDDQMNACREHEQRKATEINTSSNQVDESDDNQNYTDLSDEDENEVLIE